MKLRFWVSVVVWGALGCATGALVYHAAAHTRLPISDSRHDVQSGLSPTVGGHAVSRGSTTAQHDDAAVTCEVLALPALFCWDLMNALSESVMCIMDTVRVVPLRDHDRTLLASYTAMFADHMSGKHVYRRYMLARRDQTGWPAAPARRAASGGVRPAAFPSRIGAPMPRVPKRCGDGDVSQEPPLRRAGIDPASAAQTTQLEVVSGARSSGHGNRKVSKRCSGSCRRLRVLDCKKNTWYVHPVGCLSFIHLLAHWKYSGL
ncbi:hypothetical protein [Burkholderia ubonensis]|uniref:hypothetical protein n=1 Tax=Burkholderia ubonensis TaxID=101571 RepID=UPI0012F7BE29|nr:hypothetical protein [Burkholderia ubonensis]